MMKIQILLILFTSLFHLDFESKSVDKENHIPNYKLTESELPDGYKFISKLNCKSIQTATFYDQAETLYGIMVGEIVFKDFQSFKDKKDEGTILYFQLKDKFKGEGFLNGYLWGEKGKPSKQHPEEYALIDDNILIIWSTNSESQINLHNAGNNY